jgi:hypothetical protein
VADFFGRPYRDGLKIFLNTHVRHYERLFPFASSKSPGSPL